MSAKPVLVWRKVRKDLHVAIKKDRFEAFVLALYRLLELCSQGAEGHRQDFLNEADIRGWTCLHLACLKNRVDMVRVLLSPTAPPPPDADLCCDVESLAKLWLPANVNALTVEGSTPLVVAAYNGRLEAAKLLLELGADPGLRDAEGMTAYQRAADRRCIAVVHLLEASAPKRLPPVQREGEDQAAELHCPSLDSDATTKKRKLS